MINDTVLIIQQNLNELEMRIDPSSQNRLPSRRHRKSKRDCTNKCESRGLQIDSMPCSKDGERIS